MRAFVALLIGSLAWQSALGHTRSESHSSWQVDGAVVEVTFTVSDLEAARITGDHSRPSDDALLGYVGSRLGATSGAAPCHAATSGQTLTAAAGYRRLEFRFDCPSAHDLQLFDHAFFELVPTHVNFAQLQVAGGEFTEQVIQASSPVITLDTDRGVKMRSASLLTFVGMGIMHIFSGLDHMAFLLGLVLISRELRDLVFVVTGFTLGHSLTLALAVTGIIRPHAEFIDALVALTIALIGAENIALASRRPRTVALWTGGALLLMAALRLAGIGLLPAMLLLGSALFAADYLMISGYFRDAGRLRLLVTFVFGLIHGFGFAADLLESRLPSGKLAAILFGFNLGVEIGQLTVVLLLVGMVGLLARMRLTVPRPLVVDVTASGLVALGTYWFVSRSFHP